MPDVELPVKMNRDFKGIWVPREIWLAQGLAPTEKILWAEINSLHDRERGGCYASNDYLCDFMGVKERRLQEMIANLKSYGLIEQVSFNGRERILKAVTPEEGTIACRAEVHYNAPLGCTIPHLSGALNCTPHIYRDTSIDKSIDTPPIPPQNPKPAVAESAIASEERVLNPSDVGKAKKPPSEFPSEVKETVLKMVAALHEANPHWLIPKNPHSMLVEVQEMIAKENRSLKDIFDVFMWAVNDSFWMDKLCKPNPVKYLRSQFSQLAAKMNAKPDKKPRKFAPCSDDDKGMEIWKKMKETAL